MCLQLLICLLCTCHFIGLLHCMSYNMKRNMFCQSVIFCMDKKIFDALSYTSPSRKKARQ